MQGILFARFTLTGELSLTVFIIVNLETLQQHKTPVASSNNLE